MNAVVRAERILVALPFFHAWDGDLGWPSGITGEDLGDKIGWYGESEAFPDAIGIFRDGISWHQGAQEIALKFVDIIEVSLPSGKESEGLKLRTAIETFYLPTRGKRGRFLDSMEMLRFLDRVKADLLKQK